MPTRLAVGLGLESGPVIPLPEPLRPVRISSDFGSPASGLRKEAGFRLQRQKKINFVSLCQISNEISHVND